MKKVKKVLEIIKYNFSALIKFEFLFKLLSLLFFTPIFLKSFTWIMKLTGYNYITIENVSQFLLNPLTIIMLIILILLMMLYAMFDITTIIIILDKSYQKEKIKVMDAMHLSFVKCRNILSLKNIPLAFLILFLIPFLNIGLSSSFITTIKIPEFITDFIVNNSLYLTLLILGYILLTILLLRWLYSLHYFVLEDLSFKEARKKSKALSEKNHIKDILTLIIMQLFLTIFYFAFIILGIFLILLFNKIGGNLILLKSIATTFIWFFLFLSFIFASLLTTPVSYACISVMYYLHKKEKKEKIESIAIKSKEKIKDKNIVKKVAWAFGVISIILGTIFTYGLYKGKYNLKIEYVRKMEVTAHRGASHLYPENTLSAFKGAKELGAHWVELDVQQTKDGQIVVSHDTNLQRVTGLNKEIIEMNYEDIAKLDAGSFFAKKFKDERIPLFKDVVKWAKENNMRLNVELKPTGREHDFEKAVIDIIKEFNYEESCVLTSQVYHVLEEAKKYDNNIKTVYVMSLAVGDITLLDKADAFSLEASNINKAIIKKVHNEGKELYAWTVNKEESIRDMILLNVDNIITDDITLAKETITKSKQSNLINEFIKFIEKSL